MATQNSCLENPMEDPLEKEMATQNSCLENPIDRGDWWAAVHGIASVTKE